jgi:hypothetical protein
MAHEEFTSVFLERNLENNIKIFKVAMLTDFLLCHWTKDHTPFCFSSFHLVAFLVGNKRNFN